jgi:hypothetical protein
MVSGESSCNVSLIGYNSSMNRHLYYYLTSRVSQAPVLIFEDSRDARDFMVKNRHRHYVMNTCWGYKPEGYQMDQEQVQDHLVKD